MSLLRRFMTPSPVRKERARQLDEFKSVMPRYGIADDGKLQMYYARKFGEFDPLSEAWKDGEADIFKANPGLRRIDVIAEAVFRNGEFILKEVGEVYAPSTPVPVYEGTVAVMRLVSSDALMLGHLTLDVSPEVKFSKLRITVMGSDETYTVRASTVDRGMVIYNSLPKAEQMPETIRQAAPKGNQVFQTLADTVRALEGILLDQIKEAGKMR